MNLSNLTSAHFKQVIVMLDKKESLQAQIADLEQQIGQLLSGVGGGGVESLGRSTSKVRSAEKNADS